MSGRAVHGAGFAPGVAVGAAVAVVAMLLVEPAVIDRLGIVEREMVDFQNETSPEARARRARLRNHLPSFATFNAMWAGMMILGPAGDRRPWRVQSVEV